MNKLEKNYYSITFVFELRVSTYKILVDIFWLNNRFMKIFDGQD